MAARIIHARGVRETGVGEQPGAIWSRDSDSYLQLLESPLVSRSSSPLSVENPEGIQGGDVRSLKTPHKSCEGERPLPSGIPAV